MSSRPRNGAAQLNRGALGGMPRRPVIYMIGAVLLLGVLRAITGFLDDAGQRTTIRRGDSIVVAIETFARTEHRYPDSLTELVPGYLSTIPRPGRGFGYWRLWRPPSHEQTPGAVRAFHNPSAWALIACSDAVMTCYPSLSRSSRDSTWVYDN